MAVQPGIITGVAFVGCQKADGSYLLKGSVFFVGLEEVAGDPTKVRDIVWVTARHVVDGVRKLGCTEVCVRINTKSGGARWHHTPLNAWFSIDDVTSDVAVYAAGLPSDADHTAFTADLILTPETQAGFSFGISDEVVVVGLFQHRAGNRKNVPIVRMGNVASLDEDEHVTTKFGEMPAYLIECRSIGGLSGSPVFVSVGLERSLTGKAPGKHGIYMIGLIHGHYDVKDTNIDELDAFDAADGLRPNQVNTGIAIVTPARRLLETIEASKAARPKSLFPNIVIENGTPGAGSSFYSVQSNFVTLEGPQASAHGGDIVVERVGKPTTTQDDTTTLSQPKKD